MFFTFLPQAHILYVLSDSISTSEPLSTIENTPLRFIYTLLTSNVRNLKIYKSSVLFFLWMKDTV